MLNSPLGGNSPPVGNRCLRPLLQLQKKIVRIMTYSTLYAHTAPIFKELQILTVDKLVTHRIAIVMYKFNNGFLPAVLIGYEPAGLTVHPPPRMIESGFIFFVWVSSATKIFSLKKSGFCRRY